MVNRRRNWQQTLEICFQNPWKFVKNHAMDTPLCGFCIPELSKIFSFGAHFHLLLAKSHPIGETCRLWGAKSLKIIPSDVICANICTAHILQVMTLEEPWSRSHRPLWDLLFYAGVTYLQSWISFTLSELVFHFHCHLQLKKEYFPQLTFNFDPNRVKIMNYYAKYLGRRSFIQKLSCEGTETQTQQYWRTTRWSATKCQSVYSCGCICVYVQLWQIIGWHLLLLADS